MCAYIELVQSTTPIMSIPGALSSMSSHKSILNTCIAVHLRDCFDGVELKGVELLCKGSRVRPDTTQRFHVNFEHMAVWPRPTVSMQDTSTSMQPAVAGPVHNGIEHEPVSSTASHVFT